MGDCAYPCRGGCGAVLRGRDMDGRIQRWVAFRLLHGEESVGTKMAEKDLFRCDDCILRDRVLEPT